MDTTTPDGSAPEQAEGCPSASAVLGELALAAPELVRAVDSLTRRFRATRRLALALAAVVALLLYLVLQVLHTQQQATTVRERVLCPFYTLMVVAEAEPHPAPADPRLAQAQQVIQDGYRVLHCDSVPLEPPPH